MDLSGFSNPWEHIRLLSDRPRNEALLSLLRRRAPGARVVEVGCGTGLLSVVAAKLGAKQVWAVEPTPLYELAMTLVQDNKLGDRVQVLQGRIQDLEPRPVDLAFSELLNADPFSEQVVEASEGARPWVVEGGLLAPRRLRVWVALARAGGSAKEAVAAQREIQRLGQTYDLNLGALDETLQCKESYRFFTQAELPVSTAALVYDVRLGKGAEPAEEVIVEVEVEEPGPTGGAIVWFESELDDGIILHNRPGPECHWGQLICAWSEERGVRLGQKVQLRVTLEDHELDVYQVEP